MKNLNEYIKESILGDWEDSISDVKNTLAKEWVDKNCKGDFKIIYLKNGMHKLNRGTLIIKNVTEDIIPLTFSKVEGNIVIEKCPNIKSLEGMFAPQCVAIGGSLSIGNCDKFETLKGIPPIIDNEFNLIGNKSLKRFESDSQFTVFGSIHIMKNGSKLKEQDIEKVFKSFKHINCSLDLENSILESNINEALNEPHLLKLAKTMHDNKKSVNFSEAFRYMNIAWDEIDSSNVSVYKTYNDDALKAARKIFSAGNPGIIILVNKNNEYTHCITNNKWVYVLNPLRYSTTQYEAKATDIVELINNSEEVIIIETSGMSVQGKQIARYKALEGMVIQGDERYYKDLARDNIKRYKKIIAQNKALKDNDEVKKLSEKVQECLNRMMAATNKIMSDPVKYADSFVYLSILQNYICSSAYSSNGLLASFKEYNLCHGNIVAGNAGALYSETSKARYKQECEDTIDKCEYYFTKIGV